MPKIVENHTHKSGNYHEKGTLKNGTTPYHRQVKLPPPPPVQRVTETVRRETNYWLHFILGRKIFQYIFKIISSKRTQMYRLKIESFLLKKRKRIHVQAFCLGKIYDRIRNGEVHPPKTQGHLNSTTTATILRQFNYLHRVIQRNGNRFT